MLTEPGRGQAPATLLPAAHVRWENVDEHTARAIVSCGDIEQAVDIRVAENGRPECVLIQRWSNENPDREYRDQPFGGVLDDFKQFDGYRLPLSVEGGNHFGTRDYFPFYKARVSDIRLLGKPR